MRVLIFSTILSEAFLILKRSERDMTKRYMDLHVKYPLFLSDFNKTWIFSTDFRKIFRYQILQKPAQREPGSMRTYGRTDYQADMTKLTVAFRNFSNASKKSSREPEDHTSPNTVTSYTHILIHTVYLSYISREVVHLNVNCSTSTWS